MIKPAPPKVGSGVNNGEISCNTIRQVGMKIVNYYITTNTAALTASDAANWDVTSWNTTKYTFDSLTSGQRCTGRAGRRKGPGGDH